MIAHMILDHVPSPTHPHSAIYGQFKVPSEYSAQTWLIWRVFRATMATETGRKLDSTGMEKRFI